MSYILGIDTGGTFTDGVLIDAEIKTVHRKAKVLTTKNDLKIGISKCIEALSGQDDSNIELVCISTTLATNAVVEGKGCNAGLLLIGKAPHGKLPVKHQAIVRGLFTIEGKPVEELDEKAVLHEAKKLEADVDALAVSGYASVRNPEHELRAKSLIQSIIDLPVICAHELTGKLGYYERTVTSVLNVQLIPIIKGLIKDTKEALKKKNINAPLMIVKGDGSFMTSSYAEERAIETILSGPAASIIGAMHLTNFQEATIIDIGGTTSDIALAENGQVAVTAEGARVGGWKTQVRAADIFTFGLGGDSKMRIKCDGTITFGPDKAIPVSYSTKDMKTVYPNDKLYESLICDDESEIGFTPTDLAHVQGYYSEWNANGAQEMIKIMCQNSKQNLTGFIQEIESSFLKAVMDTLNNSRKISKNVPVIAVGAPSRTWMPIIAQKYGFQVHIPEHAEVANAIGAAVGRVEEKTEILIRYDSISGKYVGYSYCDREEFDTLEDAKKICLVKAEAYAKEKAHKAGGIKCEVLKECEDIFCSTYDGTRQTYVETKINVAVVGKPLCIACEGGKGNGTKS